MGIGTAAIALCFLTWAINPRDADSEETVDLIEINHLHDDQGRPIFDQILFYEWSPSESRYQLRDWRLLESPNQIPLASARDGDYLAIWCDPKAGDKLRSTRAKMVRESWTPFDPEQTEREFLSENSRRKLKGMVKVKAKAVPAPEKDTPPAAAATGAIPKLAREPVRTARAPLRPLQAPVRTLDAERR